MTQPERKVFHLLKDYEDDSGSDEFILEHQSKKERRIESKSVEGALCMQYHKIFSKGTEILMWGSKFLFIAIQISGQLGKCF